ncbi:MAG: ECF transporter S component [Clostridiales Family XIII bacterium]|jgi:uncharacterized membrane protein|nr:ECF transporter S component [Clostridiales Family XIII bacterium]
MSDRNSSREKTLLLVQFSILLAIEAIVCFTPLGSIPLAPPMIVATLGMIPVVVAAILLGLWAGALMGAFAGMFSLIVWTLMPPSPLMAFVFTPFASVGDAHGNFWSLLICFAPRVGVGVVTACLFALFRKILNPDDTRVWAKYLISALVTSAIVTAILAIIIYIVGTRVFGAGLDASNYWVVVVVLFVALAVLFYLLFKKFVKPETAADIVSYGASAVAGSMTNTICVLGGIYLFFGHSYAEAFRIGYDAMMGVIGLSVITNGVPEAAISALCAYFIARIIMKRKEYGDESRRAAGRS